MRFKTIAGSLLVFVSVSFFCVPTAFAEKFSEEMENPAYIPSAMDLDSFRRSTSTLFDWFRLHLMLSRLLPNQINHLREAEKKAPPVEIASAGVAHTVAAPLVAEVSGHPDGVIVGSVSDAPLNPDGIGPDGVITEAGSGNVEPVEVQGPTAGDSPVTVDPEFSVTISQMNSGELPSHALYTIEKRGDIYGLATSPAWVFQRTNRTEYRFDSVAKAVTVRTPVPGSAQSGMAPEMKAVTYTAAGNPVEYQAALVQMRDHAQAAHTLLQLLDNLGYYGAKLANIQKVIDAVNRELQ